jgi:hypothetical protein
VDHVQYGESSFARHLAAWQSLAICYLQKPAFVLVGLAALLATQVLPWWGPTPDASCYLSMARSVAEGGPMTNLGSPKLHYAPGYPILISPAFLVSERPFWLLALMQWGFATLFMWGVYRWAVRWFPSGALWITALVMVNVGFWALARLTLSEMAFMAALMASANALDRLSAGTTRREIICWALVAALGVVAVSMIRPVGIFIVAGYGCVTLRAAWTRQIPWLRAFATTMAIGLPATAAVLAFISYETSMANSLGPDATTYLDEFRRPEMSLAGQLLEGARLRISEFGRMTVPGMNKAYARTGQWLNVNMFIYIPLFVALMWSWWQIARRECSAMFWVLPFYFALYLGYPSEQGTRYMIPLLPIVAACVWRLACLAPRTRQPRILGCLVALHLCVTLGASLTETVKLYGQQSLWADVDTLMERINRDPLPLVACGAPQGSWELSQASGNRPVEWTNDPKRLTNHNGWVISAVDYDLGPGFVETARAGKLKLLSHAATQTANSAPSSAELR